jgi:hypothetical protein
MSEPSNEVQQALLQSDVNQMKDDLKELRQEVKDLLDAWKTATNVLAFIKWLAGIGAAVAFIWALIKAKLGG